MESLEKRIAERKKDREREAKERESQHYPRDNTDGSETDGEGFSASEWVDDTVANISSQLIDLDDDQLNEVEAAEKAAKNRTGVIDAIGTERTRRTQTEGGWRPQ